KRFQQMKDWMADKDVTVMAISIDETEYEWKKAIEEDGLDWMMHIRGEAGWDSPVFNNYEVQSIPTTFFLDAKGVIRSKNIRALDLQQDYADLHAKWGPK
ncbi:MAG: thioredoxin family protein, partial [Bacteroidota bacterium]